MRYLKEYTLYDAEKEVLRQTERHIQEQQQMTSAADQRAVAFAAVQIVLIGLLLADGASKTIEAGLVPIVLLLFLSVAASIYSAKPTRIYGSGSDAPSLKDYRDSPNFGYLIATIIERNERNIVHNDRVLKQSARIFRLALILSCLAAIILFSDWVDVIAKFQEIKESST